MASYHFENHCTAPETVQTLRQDHFVKSRADISKLAQMAKDILWVQNLGTDIPSREDFRDGLGGWFLGWISGIFLDQSFGKVWPNLGFVLIRYEYFTTCQWIVFWLDLGFVLTRYKYFRAYQWTFFLTRPWRNFHRSSRFGAVRQLHLNTLDAYPLLTLDFPDIR